MADVLEPLTIDFLVWLERVPRTYADVMEAWRTSCPRLTVWEDAIDRGLVCRVPADGAVRIAATPEGRCVLATHAAARHASRGAHA